MCLRESCKLFWTINYSAPPQELTYNIQFLKERTRFADPGGVGDLVPELPDPDSPDAPFSTERNSWRGIVCPKCRSCISRKFWDSWRCETEGCNFVLKVKHQIHSAGSLLPDNQREYSGRALPLNKFWAPVIEPEEELFGCWRIQKFTVFPGNTITHFMSNGPINQKPAGAHQMLRELQTVDLDLRRLPLSACEGESIPILVSLKLTSNSQRKFDKSLYLKLCKHYPLWCYVMRSKTELGYAL